MIEEQDTSNKLQFKNADHLPAEHFGNESEPQISFDPAFCGLSVLTKITPIVIFFALSELKILDFTLVLVSASVDFWVVKNIFGRKLVGMTWWMKIDEQSGEETWIFHSSDCQKIDSINYNVFWSINLGSAIFWGFASLLSVLVSRLFWISICGVCFILSAINFLFYLRCRGNHQENFKGIADKLGMQSAHSLVGDY